MRFSRTRLSDALHLSAIGVAVTHFRARSPRLAWLTRKITSRSRTWRSHWRHSQEVTPSPDKSEASPYPSAYNAAAQSTWSRTVNQVRSGSLARREFVVGWQTQPGCGDCQVGRAWSSMCVAVLRRCYVLRGDVQEASPSSSLRGRSPCRVRMGVAVGRTARDRFRRRGQSGGRPIRCHGSVSGDARWLQDS
jgi:hypothetical protein